MPIRDNEIFGKCFLADTLEEANELLTKYEKDIGFLASKLSNITGVDRDDLHQEGVIGLARAKRDFERDRSAKFRIYAIYKIKDAMKEFITKQASNVRIPQYVRNAAKLMEHLDKSTEKLDGIKRSSFIDIWAASEYYKDKPPQGKEPIVADIVSIRRSIENLADRSHTSVIQLLERAELAPTSSAEMVDRDLNTLSADDTIFSNSMLFVEDIKENMREEDYDLLYRHYVLEETLREMSPSFGVTPETLCVRIQNLKDSLVKKYGARIADENNIDIKETEQRDSS
jgi:RNA polymerase sigma factor (sigma-70 family)